MKSIFNWSLKDSKREFKSMDQPMMLFRWQTNSFKVLKIAVHTLKGKEHLKLA